jgi:glycogen synthase
MTADAVGGVWHYVIQLAALLARAGNIRVMLAVMGPPPTEAQLADAAAVPGLSVRSGQFALEWMPGAWDDVDAAGDWLLGLAEQFAPDIVHLNGYCHADLPWPAPTLVVAHSCVCSWWEAVHGCRPPHEWDAYVDRVRRGLHAADAVVTPSRSMNGALELYYGFSSGRVIPNCRSSVLSTQCRKESLVFAAGRVWDPAKNLAVLDSVAAALPWPVYVAGPAAAPGEAERTLTHARPLGPIGATAVAQWMARAAIYALPARYEPFGLSVLEAARSGCALVLGDIPSLRENWSGAARFVPPAEHDRLAATLQELMDHPAERAALGHAARLRAGRFDPAQHVSAYQALYLEMVTRHDGVAHPARSH